MLPLARAQFVQVLTVGKKFKFDPRTCYRIGRIAPTHSFKLIQTHYLKSSEVITRNAVNRASNGLPLAPNRTEVGQFSRHVTMYKPRLFVVEECVEY